MRVLLRDSSRDLFLKCANLWTSDITEAQTFKHSAEAMDFARRMSLRSAEVVLDFGDPVDSVILPVPCPFDLGLAAPTPEPKV